MSISGTNGFSISANIIRCLLFGLIFFSDVNVNGQNVSKNVIIDDKVDTKVDAINYRLPNNTKPETYDITLTTNIDQNDFNFSGCVVIKLCVLEASYNITIHARQLTIKTVELATTSGTEINLNLFTYDNAAEFLVISSQTELQKDSQYVLTIKYSGELGLSCYGFYRTSYIDSMGVRRKVS